MPTKVRTHSPTHLHLHAHNESLQAANEASISGIIQHTHAQMFDTISFFFLVPLTHTSQGAAFNHSLTNTHKHSWALPALPLGPLVMTEALRASP